MYQVFARKYRPQVFEDVLAQDHITRTLANAVRTSRVAHGYLFTGPRGVGKTTTARILAKALNCDRGPTPTPCCECASCIEITEGRSLDVLEIDGASNNGVEEIRRLRERIGLSASQERRRKIYIIDEVHMLSTSAFNALLKTLEEPPPHVIFVFATTEPHKVPATISSRCQRFDFRRVPNERIVEQLRLICCQEQVSAEDGALFLVARAADGAMRDAESLFDQILAFSDGDVTARSARDILGLIDEDVYFGITDAISDKNIGGAIGCVDGTIDAGADIGLFCLGLMEHFRHLLFARIEGLGDRIEVPEESRLRYRETAKRFSEGDLLRMIKAVSDAEQSISRSTSPRLRLDVLVVRLVTMDSTVVLSDLLRQIPEQALTAAGPGAEQVAAPVSNRHLPAGSRAAGPSPSAGEAEKLTSGRSGPTPAPCSSASGSGAAVLPVSEASAPRSDGLQPAGLPLTLDGIRDRWQESIECVKREQISLGTFLSSARPECLDGESLKLSFDREHAFHAGEVQRKRKLVDDTLSRILGQRISVECLTEDNTPAANGAAGADWSSGPAAQETALGAVMQVFEGELIKG